MESKAKKIYFSKKNWIRNCTVLRNGCWRLNHRMLGPYGVIDFPGGVERAHRKAFTIFKGPISKNKIVTHSCDYKPCANPEHLFAKTHGENVKEGWDRNPNSINRREQLSKQSKIIAKRTFSNDKFRNLQRAKLTKRWKDDSSFRKAALAALTTGRQLLKRAANGTYIGKE